MKYQHEQFSKWFMEAQQMFHDHWLEIEAHCDRIPLDPDFHRMLKIEGQGLMESFTVRDGDKLAGYLLFFVSSHLHHRGDTFAQVDLFYIVPQYRVRPGIARRLVRLAELWLCEYRGVSEIEYSLRIGRDKAGRLLEALGYEPLYVTYGKTVKADVVKREAA